MTDADVMKNTRCCADNYCKNCSLQGKPNCKNMLLSFAWDTMYNQKAEIERLKKGWKADVIETQNTKAEAIKEFAERLKEKLWSPVETWITSDIVTEEDIDNTVKEWQVMRNENS